MWLVRQWRRALQKQRTQFVSSHCTSLAGFQTVAVASMCESLENVARKRKRPKAKKNCLFDHSLLPWMASPMLHCLSATINRLPVSFPQVVCLLQCIASSPLPMWHALKCSLAGVSKAWEWSCIWHTCSINKHFKCCLFVCFSSQRWLESL